MSVNFDQEELLKKFTVTSLEAPHRIADAIFRDSLLDGVIFRKSPKGCLLDSADIRNATGLFGLCPTALVFGLWDSTGPRGGQGAKFQRALVSEMVGYDAVLGTKTSSRIDPLQIQLGAGPLFVRSEKSGTDPDWTPEESKAGKERNQPIKLGKDGKPSEANHGNVMPSWSDGGFTVSRVRQTTVLSLSALRRLRFPLNGAPLSDPAVDQAARVVLAALGLAAATLSREEGADLRSRCQLFPTSPLVWQLLDLPTESPRDYTLDAQAATKLLKESVKEATTLGLPWEDEILLTPHPDLVRLVRKSQELAAHQESGAD